MKLNELFDNNSYDTDGFVLLSEGMASKQTDQMHTLVAQAKGLVNSLDEKMARKFRIEFNKRLGKFNDALAKGSVRDIESKLYDAKIVYKKYHDKV